MIDFHTHIIPNVDDGARNIEETINLIKEACKVGFNGIIATPHYRKGYHEEKREEEKFRLSEISNIIKQQGIDINLYLGNEIYLSDNILEELKENNTRNIGNTDYILIELPLNTKPIDLYNMIYELLGNKKIPILAHPERYTYIQSNPNEVCMLIEKGVMIQCNYGSVIGQYGKKAEIIVKKLLKNNMVHFLGSDVHRGNTIYPKIPKILEKLDKMIGEEKLKEISRKNPRLILENKKIEIAEPVPLHLSVIEKIKMKRYS